MKNKKMSRRSFASFFSKTAIGSTVLGNTLLETIINGRIAEAQAQGNTPMNYIHCQIPRAAIAHNCNLFLNPYNDNNFVGNPMIGTRFQGGGNFYSEFEYTTVEYKGVRCPHIWSANVPNAAGGTRPMNQVLDNTFHICGVNSENPAHPMAFVNRYLPPGSKQSIGAIASDKYDSYLPSIQVGAGGVGFRHVSTRQRGYISLNHGNNLFTDLLRPFLVNTPQELLTRKAAIKKEMDDAVKAIVNQGKNDLLFKKNVIENYQNSSQLISQGFGDLEAQWDELYGKYTTLINRAINNTTVAGIDDLPVGKPVNMRNNNEQAFYQANGQNVGGDDLRSIFGENARHEAMAANFALAEFVLKSGLSRSIALAFEMFDGIDMNGSNNWDHHNVGIIASFYSTFKFHLCFHTCMLELQDQLKLANLWNNTLIDVGSEFNRSIRNNGSGSDHLDLGMNLLLMSGLIEGPYSVGDLRADRGGGYSGTQGDGVVNPGIGRRYTNRDVQTTISTILKCPAEIDAGYNFCKYENNKLVPNVPLTKIVNT